MYLTRNVLFNEDSNTKTYNNSKLFKLKDKELKLAFSAPRILEKNVRNSIEQPLTLNIRNSAFNIRNSIEQPFASKPI